VFSFASKQSSTIISLSHRSRLSTEHKAKRLISRFIRVQVAPQRLLESETIFCQSYKMFVRELTIKYKYMTILLASSWGRIAQTNRKLHKLMNEGMCVCVCVCVCGHLCIHHYQNVKNYRVVKETEIIDLNNMCLLKAKCLIQKTLKPKKIRNLRETFCPDDLRKHPLPSRRDSSNSRFSSAVESFLLLFSCNCTHYYDFPLILIKTCSAG